MSLYENINETQAGEGIEKQEDNIKFMKTHLKLKRISKPTKIINNPLLTVSEINEPSIQGNNIFDFNFPNNSYDPAKPNEYIAWADKFGHKTSFILPAVTDTIKPKPNLIKIGGSKEGSNLPSKVADLSSIRKTPSSSLGDSFGQAMLAKYGWKEGQGLGKNQQGISVALKVEKVGHNTGKIIDRHAQIKKYLAKLQSVTEQRSEDTQDSSLDNNDQNSLKDKTTVILLLNMFDADDNDEEVKSELFQECNQKYGKVKQILIHKIMQSDTEHRIGIFVEFINPFSATKAIQDLNERYFGGKVIQALYYDHIKFKNQQYIF